MARRIRSHEGNVVASVPWHPRLGTFSSLEALEDHPRTWIRG